MNVPHVSRVTVPQEPARNGQPPKIPPVNVEDRLEALTDGMFTTNRALIALRAELESLRWAVLFAAALAAALYVWKGR
jgi:hypothetical protein